MDLERQQAKADAFRRMHHGPDLLLLPNVWDAASARIIEDLGFPAIATSSAGVAFALGKPDGERVAREQMLEAIARIAAVVQTPVTADAESGYGTRPEDVAATARAVISAGAVGMNLEDAFHDRPAELMEISAQVERILAVLETARAAGVPLVLNARTDVYLLQIGPPEQRFAAAVERLSRYRDAGADCLFVPGVRDPAVIAQFVRELRHPVNILAGPGSPSVPELRKLGVRRVSFGSATMRATLGLLRRAAQELRSVGTYQTLQDAPSHLEVNKLMEKRG